MNKFLLQFIVLLLLYGTASAQNRQITGKVVSQSGETLIGVSVGIKGTSQGASTDANGAFKLNVPATGNVVLVLKYIGYKQLEVAVGDRSQITLTMQEDATMLNEVKIVNIGYGTVSRNALTGSVSSVSARQLRDIPVNSTAEALAGRLAGVQITQSEGSPNASATIRVRGGGSITQDNSPLYVVDGIQVENALASLAPQDIESVDVLKDAASTAIYGARGANGVVIITTKGGRVQKPTVTYNGLVGMRQLANKLDVMQPYDFVKYWYERSSSSTADRTSFTKTYGDFNDLDLYKEVPFVDWQDQMFGRNALMQTHNVSLTGGTETTKYNVSVTSNTEDGIMLGSSFDRKLLNLRLDQKITNKLSAGFAIRYNNTIVNGAGTSNEGSSATNRLRHSVKYRPLLIGAQDVTAYDPDYANETNGNSLSLVNPILLNEAEYRKNNNNLTNLSGNVSYQLTKMINLKTTFGYDWTSNRQNSFNDTITSISRQNSNQPTATVNTASRVTINNSNVINIDFDKSGWAFSKRNSLTVLLGQEVYQNKENNILLDTRLFPLGITPESALGNLGLGTALPITTTEYTNRIFSLFGRVHYGFDNKYLLDLSVRGDGSSKFSEGNKWGYFPSASFAWRLSDEKFFSNLKNTFGDFKLRASYGQAGNNRIADFLYLTQFAASSAGSTHNTNFYYSNNDQLLIGYRPTALANNELTWETTISRNLGLDFSILNNRVQFTADVYRNTTKNLLVSVPVPTTSGYTEQIQNVGATSNNGVELQINASPIQRKDFSWNVNFNISYNKNKVESLGDFQKQSRFSSGWAGSNQPADYLLKVGQPVGTILGLITDGYYTLDDFDYAAGKYTLKAGVPNSNAVTALPAQPGVIKFKDISGPNGTPDGVVDDYDRTIIGDTQPKFFGGFNQQFSYKNFDLSMFLNFQLGNDVLNANKLEFTSGYTPNSNLLSIMNDRWRNVNDQGQVVTDPTALAALNANAKIWSPLTSASSFIVHSWAVENGSFLRINNVTLGYTFPSSIINKIKVNRLRVYGTVNNLAVITGYSGYDPEVNTRRSTPLTPGVDYSAYPRSRAFIFGVNLTL